MSDERTSLLLNPETGNPGKEFIENNVQETLKEAYLYDAFNEGEINNLTCDDKPELITLMGLSSSGKTTFAGSLYALLRRRSDLLGVTFLDSGTLTGFEKKVYLRRINGANKSAVKRTLRSDGSILNVIITEEGEKRSRMLLFSDKAGESYGDVLDNADEAKKHIAVKYANKLVLFLDSDEILNRFSSYKDKLLTLLTVFNNAGMLPEEKRVITVFNKIDMVHDANISQEEWGNREKALLDIVDRFFSVENNVYRINSLGIKYGEEHDGLISLFKSLLSRNTTTPLSNEYNWITKLTRSAK